MCRILGHNLKLYLCNLSGMRAITNLVISPFLLFVGKHLQNNMQEQIQVRADMCYLCIPVNFTVLTKKNKTRVFSVGRGTLDNISSKENKPILYRCPFRDGR